MFLLVDLQMFDISMISRYSSGISTSDSGLGSHSDHSLSLFDYLTLEQPPSEKPMDDLHLEYLFDRLSSYSVDMMLRKMDRVIKLGDDVHSIESELLEVGVHPLRLNICRNTRFAFFEISFSISDSVLSEFQHDLNCITFDNFTSYWSLPGRENRGRVSSPKAGQRRSSKVRTHDHLIYFLQATKRFEQKKVLKKKSEEIARAASSGSVFDAAQGLYGQAFV